MSERHQYRIVFSNPSHGNHGTVFIDAESEAAALKFFAQAFPSATVVSVRLEPVSVCGSYERRPT